MKVWYCSDGGVAWIEGMSPGDGVGCRPYWITEMGTSYQRDHVIKHGCGWMQLVPADALVIQKVNGEWPKWIEEVIEDFDQPVVRAFLDRLVEAQT